MVAATLGRPSFVPSMDDVTVVAEVLVPAVARALPEGAKFLPPLRRVAQQLLMVAATLGRLSIVLRRMMLQWCRGAGTGSGQDHCRRVPICLGAPRFS